MTQIVIFISFRNFLTLKSFFRHFLMKSKRSLGSLTMFLGIRVLKSLPGTNWGSPSRVKLAKSMALVKLISYQWSGSNLCFSFSGWSSSSISRCICSHVCQAAEAKSRILKIRKKRRKSPKISIIFSFMKNIYLRTNLLRFSLGAYWLHFLLNSLVMRSWMTLLSLPSLRTSVIKVGLRHNSARNSCRQSWVNSSSELIFSWSGVCLTHCLTDSLRYVCCWTDSRLSTVLLSRVNRILLWAKAADNKRKNMWLGTSSTYLW